MLNTKLITAINNFSTHTVLVVGDVMLDTYYNGKVNRVSPEAPVPVLDLATITHKLGGAANVAYNLKALQAHTILLSVVGNDATAQELSTLLNEHTIEAHLVIDESRCTTQKTRYIAQQSQLLRVDKEDVQPISQIIENKVIAAFSHLITTTKIDAVILEDYNKGLLTPTLINTIITACNTNNITVLIDPKKDNFFEFKNATIFKPNLKEITEAMHLHSPTESELKTAAEQLRTQLNAQLLMVTLADKGILLCSAQETKIVPAQKRSVADVSGAGDTVIATVALSALQNLSWTEIATLSNLAGGAVCEKMGVVPITCTELIDEIKKSVAQ